MGIPTKQELSRILDNRDVAGAAEMYKVSKSTLYRWMYRLKIPKPEKVGTKNSNSKLSEEQVLEVYGMRGKATIKSLSELYGVSASAICNIHNMASHTELLIEHDLRSEVA